jgi:hypothetical protein
MWTEETRVAKDLPPASTSSRGGGCFAGLALAAVTSVGLIVAMSLIAGSSISLLPDPMATIFALSPFFVGIAVGLIYLWQPRRWVALASGLIVLALILGMGVAFMDI